MRIELSAQEAHLLRFALLHTINFLSVNEEESRKTLLKMLDRIGRAEQEELLNLDCDNILATPDRTICPSCGKPLNDCEYFQSLEDSEDNEPSRFPLVNQDNPNSPGPGDQY